MGKHRDELKAAPKRVSDKAKTYANALKQRASESKEYTIQCVSELKGNAMQRVSDARKYAIEKSAQMQTTASKPNVKVTALSAAGGAVTLGAGGGLVGMTAGAGIGAAVGVAPAIFTFGLSIPVCAF